MKLPSVFKHTHNMYKKRQGHGAIQASQPHTTSFTKDIPWGVVFAVSSLMNGVQSGIVLKDNLLSYT